MQDPIQQIALIWFHRAYSIEHIPSSIFHRAYSITHYQADCRVAFENKACNLYVSHSNSRLKVGHSYQEYYNLAQMILLYYVCTWTGRQWAEETKKTVATAAALQDNEGAEANEMKLQLCNRTMLNRMEACTARGWNLMEKTGKSFHFPFSASASHSRDIKPTHRML